jgi:hypothetical protein
VALKVFNVRGGLAATLVNEKQAPGRHRISFTSDRMAAGCYLLRLETAGRRLDRKVVVLR